MCFAVGGEEGVAVFQQTKSTSFIIDVRKLTTLSQTSSRQRRRTKYGRL